MKGELSWPVAIIKCIDVKLSFCKGASLKAALIQQHYHPPDLNLLFTEIVPPDLNELFIKKKARFNKRTSSAIWTSPILKPGMNF